MTLTLDVGCGFKNCKNPAVSKGLLVSAKKTYDLCREHYDLHRFDINWKLNFKGSDNKTEGVVN